MYMDSVGDTAYFDVSRSYVINDGKLDSFHWDFNGDGKNDLTTYEPHAEHRFDTPYEGKVLVWACSASSAFCGLGEIDIKVAAKNGSSPEDIAALNSYIRFG